jgi:alcohol dehydrogenase (cytochrome c)
MRLLLLFALTAANLCAQGLDPQKLLAPPVDTWPTYNGDYSGRRFSSLDTINRSNVHGLTLAWAFQTHSVSVKSTPLEVNGILYFSVPDHVWAVDAATGRQVWHFSRPSQGDHLGSRGVGMYQNRLFFGTSDAHVIALDARTGKQVWDTVVADVTVGYYVSAAPLIVRGQVIVGTSGDSADVPHFLLSLDPATGKVNWRWNAVPRPGEPGADSWPDADSMSHGGGSLWGAPTYDPELDLIYLGTGNPHPILAGGVRKGDDLFTCAIVAIHAGTGKLAWYFQPSPHDTHDWDAIETTVLVDGDFHGARRKMLLQASRNGYYFVLDRETGKSLLTAPFAATDWASQIDQQGQPVPSPAKEPQQDGVLVHANMDGATNWMAPSFDPQTRLFYVNTQDAWSLWYLVLNEDKKPDGHQGGTLSDFWSSSQLKALDYQTGKTVWKRDLGPGHSFTGVLTTAGHLLFSGDTSGNVFALDPANGDALWHVYAGGTLNSSPMTYQLNGRQYVITAIDSVIYAWTLPPAANDTKR